MVVVVVVMVVKEASKQMFTEQNLVDCSKRQC